MWMNGDAIHRDKKLQMSSYVELGFTHFYMAIQSQLVYSLSQGSPTPAPQTDTGPWTGTGP